MIALTQEKREELITYNTEKLKGLKNAVVQTAFEPVKGELELEIQSTEITLASLTAEPVAYTSEFALVDVYIGDTAMMGKWNEVGDTPLFTAPPVPEISQLENDVKNIIQLLSDREWAEHCTSTELGKELEGKITDLHNEVPEIKFPEKPDYCGDFTSFKDPVSAYKDGVVDGHKWYEKAFKRLNGWGE